MPVKGTQRVQEEHLPLLRECDSKMALDSVPATAAPFVGVMFMFSSPNRPTLAVSQTRWSPLIVD